MDSFKWPDGYRSAATFTFDVDASSMEYYHCKNVSGAYSAGDYGPKAGIPRILKLLDKYKMKSTFYVPGWVAERFPERIREVHDRGHEIAPHGYLHEDMTKVTDKEEKEIWEKSCKILTDLTGIPPKGFRIPGGPITIRTLEEVKKFGAYHLLSTCANFYPSIFKTKNTKGVEIEFAWFPFSWTLDDFPFFWGGVLVGPLGQGFLPISSPSEALEYWIAEFDSIHEIGGLFNMVNHPRAIGRPSRMRILEKLIQHIKETSGVWVASVSEIADWVFKNKTQA
jgi:peptidoglycan/xylan/chitin deacetylase (PgdA/CDA1 family)